MPQVFMSEKKCGRGMKRRLLAVLLTSVAMAALTVAGQGVVEEVRIRPKQDASLTQSLRRLARENLKTAPGEELDRAVLSKDVVRLYETGYFREDIETQIERTEDGEAVVTILIAPRPWVRKVTVHGNKHISTSRLRTKIAVDPGKRLSGKELVQSRRAIQKAYARKNFHNASVETKVERVEGERNRVDVVVDITEGNRPKVKKVAFEGNNAFSDKKLRKRIASVPKWWNPWGYMFGKHLNPQRLERDKMRLRRLYLRQGYLDFEITDINKKLSAKGKKIALEFQVIEGEQYRVEAVAFEGNSHFTDGELAELVEVEAGEKFDVQKVRNGKNEILRLYGAQGYLDAECRIQREVDPSQNNVKLTYRLAEDGVILVGDVEITGNEVTQDRVIRRELTLHPGDRFSSTRMRESRQRLKGLGYFKSVNLTPVPTETAGKKDLEVKVEEKRTGNLMIGAGYSSESDLLGTFEVSIGNFDWKNWPTFRGGGQKLRLRLRAGTEKSEYSVSFIEPWLFHRRLRMQVEGYRNTREEDQYDRQQMGGSISFTRQWFRNWRQRIGLTVEEVELREFDRGVSNELFSEKGTYTHNLLSLELNRDTRNRARKPTRGSRVEFGLDLIPDFAGSYSDVYKVRAKGVKFLPLWFDTVLKFSASAGIVDEISGQQPAIFDRLFAGGASTFRGFERREVGPVDVNDEPVGGEARVLGTVEYMYPLADWARISLFCDTGNVWEDMSGLDPGEMNVSVGSGLQLELPIGPLRFDYGIPVKTEQGHLEDASGRLHFSMGYTF